jgi:hypothetical protein
VQLGTKDGHVIDDLEVIVEGEIVALHHLLRACVLIEVPHPIQSDAIDDTDVI